MELSDIQRKFILHWGEMGTRWGINRTVAQIHALLFIAPDPLNAETIATTLSVARSNVSTSLRELQGWGICKIVHKLGDRRDHFTTLQDVWEMYQIVMDERKRREIDPTTELLRELLAECEPKSSGGGGDTYTRKRLGEMLEFIDTMSTWYDQLRKLPRSAYVKMAQMGSKFLTLLGGSKSAAKKGAS